MRYLLDTDICIFVLRRQRSLRERFAEHLSQGIAISVVTLAELRYGAACSTKAAENQLVIDHWLESVTVLEVTNSIAYTFAERKASLRAQGSLIEDFDLLIGATAIAHELTLVTNNFRHFERIDGVRLERWLDE